MVVEPHQKVAGGVVERVSGATGGRGFVRAANCVCGFCFRLRVWLSRGATMVIGISMD